ncbi:MAG: hypothetical protein WBC61_01820, partial [Dehalococcoidia bacterium]
MEDFIQLFTFCKLVFNEILTAKKLAQVSIEPWFKGADANVLPVLRFICIVPRPLPGEPSFAPLGCYPPYEVGVYPN